MQIKITPLVKGIITAVLMIAVILGIYSYRESADSRWQYLVYIFYGLGITWTIMAYRSSPSFTGKFGNIFNQGFRCFIMVTLAMAIFYGVFNYMHPEFATEAAKARKEELMKDKDNDRLPSEIESEVAKGKKQYTLILVSGAIFGYLIIGAGITAAVSALVTRRK